MTVIAALHVSKTNSTWIGSDGQCNNNGTIQTGIKKWVVRGSWAAGAAGSLRTSNLLTARADSLFRDLKDPFEFSCRMRDVLKDDGYNSDKDEGPRCYGQQMILASNAGVWMIGVAFEIVEIRPDDLWADGSGRPFALGAGLISLGQGISAEDSMRLAIGAAKKYDDHCGGATFIEELTAS